MTQQIALQLTPSWKNDRVVAMVVCLTCKAPSFEVGQRMFSINLKTANRVFNRLLSPIVITDGQGEVPCTQDESVFATHITWRNHYAARATTGDVCIAYTVAVEEGLGNPIFDLGNEPGGAMGSGATFLPRLWNEKLEVELEWDLAGLPSGCTGVWTYGRGDCRAEIDAEALQMTSYMVGRVQWIEQGQFGFYWFDNSALQAREIGQWMGELFARMADFFEDTGGPYRITTRSKRYGAGEGSKIGKKYGGTALRRSYMWLYDEAHPPEPDQLRHLFPHEAVHNWVHLGTGEEPFGTCTWYVEGMAEYYSALLPYQYGIIDRDELRELLNGRCRDYYQNPHLTSSNLACGALLMADADATRIPYGRGFFYLTGVDAQIRRATGGAKCLDDVMLAILHRQRDGEKPGNAEFLAEVQKLTGCDVGPEFETMANGGPLVPAADCFGGALTVVPSQIIRADGSLCEIYLYR